METKDVIYELRTKKNMSQDELAEKLFVTRQAVSRWENGETVPNTETLKLLSELFDVSINTLLGAPRMVRSTKSIASGVLLTARTRIPIWISCLRCVSR